MEDWNDGIVVDKRILSILILSSIRSLPLTQQSSIPKPISPIFQHSNIPIGAKPATCIHASTPPCMVFSQSGLSFVKLKDRYPFSVLKKNEEGPTFLIVFFQNAKLLQRPAEIRYCPLFVVSCPLRILSTKIISNNGRQL